MEPSVCRLVLLVLFATATVTEAMSYLALPRMGRSESQHSYYGLPFAMPRKRSDEGPDHEKDGGYIAFPRLGKRGYLAFPRLGRAQTGSDASDSSATCCSLGLKTEWVLGEDGKTEVRNICPADVTCCEGMQEILDQKPDGAFYSLCIPSCYSGDEKTSEASENVLRKLKGLLQN